MFSAAEEITERFTEREIRYRLQNTEEQTRVYADVLVDYTTFSVVFIADGEDSDISVRIPHYVRFLEKEYSEVLRVTNEMNDKYRFCKFTVNRRTGAVTLEYDFPQDTANIGDAAVEIFQRMIQIAEEAYPVFMRAIWSKPEPPVLGNIVFHDFQVE